MQVVATGYGRIEGPVWDPARGLRFSGDDLRDSFVVSGSRGAPTDRSGTVYGMRVDVAGLPLGPCRVRLG
jgi:hypothetical protein